MTDAIPRSRRPLSQLFGISFALIAIWVGVAIFFTSEFHRRTIAIGARSEALPEILLLQLSTSMLWATLTPLIVALAERLPLRKPHLLRNTALMLASLPLIAILRAALGGIVLNLAERHPVSVDMMRLSVALRTHRNIFIAAVIVIIANLILAQREAAARAHRELAAQTLLAHAELEELRAQIQPHFLFLTLRTIAEVLERDPKRADAMVVSLAGLLRRSLTVGSAPVPLSGELEFADRYLDLYRIGFGERLIVRIDVEENVMSARVPPLLVQQLAEHAVVHGIAPLGGGELWICGKRAGDTLVLETRDEGAATARVDHTGLAPVLARLERLFGTLYSVTMSGAANAHVVTVTIPLDADADAFDSDEPVAEAV